MRGAEPDHGGADEHSDDPQGQAQRARRGHPDPSGLAREVVGLRPGELPVPGGQFLRLGRRDAGAG